MTDQQATEPDTLLGTTLAETYIMEKVLGEGAMGRVYLARHTRITVKRFAIKVLHKEYADHEEARARFEQEAEAAALISSPHVVGVHDYGKTVDGRPFLVSDFLVGEELADRLHREGQLPVGEAVRIVRQLCAGLAMAHANSITHRDVKPENVFLVGTDDDLTAKLLDFGISRFRDDRGKALTQIGTALGTPDFMAPEQARGHAVDHRTDIYAVGVMLYAMLTGVMPFERDNPQETLLALLTEEAPPPRQILPSIPVQLELIIQQAMAKEPDDRYPWIVQLSQALAPFDPTHAAGLDATVAQLPTEQAAPTPPSTGAPTASEVAPPQPAGLAVYDDPHQLAAARGWIVGAFVLGAPATFLALLLAVVGLLYTADVDLNVTTWLVVAVVLLLALGPGTGVALRHVTSKVWGNSVATAKFARVLRAPLVAAGITYAVGAILLRLVLFLVLEDEAWPLGDTILTVVALVAGLIGLLSARGRG
ncbi:MAG: serine/threonine protein kinase [Deltaproteobacteria bacterium]|nr:serine/threonine protein kinase [Deltaproteobacteria bacterium]